MYRGVLQGDSNNANAWCYLGIACHDLDRFDEAAAAYQRAIQIQPKFPIAYNNLGNTLRMQKRLAESLRCFDEALRQQPGYVNAHKNKGTALVWEGCWTKRWRATLRRFNWRPTTPKRTRTSASSCCCRAGSPKAGGNTAGVGGPKSWCRPSTTSPSGTAARWTERRFCWSPSRDWGTPSISSATPGCSSSDTRAG
jgi:hypothetical protein